MSSSSSVMVARELASSYLRRVSLAEYHRMVDGGVFGEDEHLELLEGVLIQMSPQGVPHAHVIARLNELFQPGTQRSYEVRCQLPLTLQRSEPEPDFAVVDKRRARRAPRHPDHALLVVEVASDSLGKDLGVKAALYAHAGVREYWVVDVERSVVVVHRRPRRHGGTWASTASVSSGARLRPEAAALAHVEVPVAALFKKRGR